MIFAKSDDDVVLVGLGWDDVNGPVDNVEEDEGGRKALPRELVDVSCLSLPVCLRGFGHHDSPRLDYSQTPRGSSPLQRGTGGHRPHASGRVTGQVRHGTNYDTTCMFSLCL